MDKKFLNLIAPIIKEKPIWDAFIAILNYEEEKLIKKLIVDKSADELIRMNAEYKLIQRLKRLRENVLDAKPE